MRLGGRGRGLPAGLSRSQVWGGEASGEAWAGLAYFFPKNPRMAVATSSRMVPVISG